MQETLSRNLERFTEFSNRFIPEIDKFISEFIAGKTASAEYDFIRELYPLIEEFCLRPGKRIRPLIFLLSYLGYERGKNNNEDIIKIAAVIEMLHAYLLVQDDIIDRSPLRRGEKTLHVLCQDYFVKKTRNRNIGNDIALILADVLFANLIEIIGSTGIKSSIKNDFLLLFSKTYELTAWGQILDIMNTMPVCIDIDSQDPMHVSLLKTAHYTVLSPMVMGLVLSGRKDQDEEKALSDFAIPLGVAFQIKDDVLGVFGDRYSTGKPSDSDIIEGKFTLLVQKAVSNLNIAQRKEFVSIFLKEKKTQRDIKMIRDILDKSGALEYSYNRIDELADASRQGLNALKIRREEKAMLSGLIDSIAE